MIKKNKIELIDLLPEDLPGGVDDALLIAGVGKSLSEIVEDRAGVGFEMRFGGHRQNIPAWHSGCVACLYSCPGSKLGNARSTVRDFADGLVLFRLREGVLPADGTEVEVRLQLVG